MSKPASRPPTQKKRKKENERDKLDLFFQFFSFFFYFFFSLFSRPPSKSFQKQSAGLDSSLAVSTSHPLSVTTSVCSNCADFSPSVVTLVHPSGHVESRHPPALTIGSIVNICPSFIIPTALLLA